MFFSFYSEVIIFIYCGFLRFPSPRCTISHWVEDSPQLGQSKQLDLYLNAVGRVITGGFYPKLSWAVKTAGLIPKCSPDSQKSLSGSLNAVGQSKQVDLILNASQAVNTYLDRYLNAAGLVKKAELITKCSWDGRKSLNNT